MDTQIVKPQPLVKHFLEIAELCAGNNIDHVEAFYKWEAEVIETVQVEKLPNLKQYQDRLGDIWQVQPQQCFSNCYYLTLYEEHFKFVYGMITTPSLGWFPIEHAFLMDTRNGKFYCPTVPNVNEFSFHKLFVLTRNQMITYASLCGYAGGEMFLDLYYRRNVLKDFSSAKRVR